jgi:hypothetical protein
MKIKMGFLREEAGEAPDGGGAGGEGGGEAPWYQSAGFSEDTLADESVAGLLGKYQSPDEFAKGAANLNKKIGEKGIIPPGEDASPEERAEFYNQLGRPESPEKYSWEPPEGMELDKEIFQDRLGKLHEAGLSDAQVSQAMNLYAEEVNRGLEDFQNQQAEVAKETEASLKEEWGKDYDERVKSAAKVAEKFGVIDAFKESGLINNLGVIKLLDGVARSTREDGVDGSQGAQGTAEEQLASIKAHPGWKDKTHPEHRSLVERAVSLRAKL